ncbi:hypothetical protein UP09_09280 [Bradyrhizobium sp. LTSP885]|nr:hypothetical protein UP09_09280 [Bradyrhizobium sp. LTSP885]
MGGSTSADHPILTGLPRPADVEVSDVTKLAKFRPFKPRCMTPSTVAATHCNDNLPGFRRPEGRRRRPTPACHWILIDGRLECRWSVEDNNPDQQRRAGRLVGPRSITMRRAVMTAARA